MNPDTLDRLETLRRRKDELVEKKALNERRMPSRRPIEESTQSDHEILLIILEEQSLLFREVLETLTESVDRISTTMEKLCDEIQHGFYYSTKRVDKPE